MIHSTNRNSSAPIPPLLPPASKKFASPPNATEAACENVDWHPFAGVANPNPDDYSDVKSWGAYAQLEVTLGSFAKLTYVPTYREADIGCGKD